MRVSLCALFCAAALLLSFVEIPLIPAAPFLKYDPSTIMALVAGLAFGPATGAVVAVLPWCVHLFIEPVGAFIAMITALCVTLVTAWLYALHRTKVQGVLALVVGGFVQVVLALLLNLWLTPLYTGISFEAVCALVLPFLLPFNVVKAILNASVTFIMYKPLSRLIGQ